jgi:hypothetical protein
MWWTHTHKPLPWRWNIFRKIAFLTTNNVPNPNLNMPRSRQLGIAILMTFVLAGGLRAQTGALKLEKPFEGRVSYDVSYTGPLAETIEITEPPKKMDMLFKDGDFIIHTYGGAFPKTLLYINDSNRTYVLDMKKGEAYRGEKYKRRFKKPLKATPTGDSLKILKHWCYGYKVERPGNAKLKIPAATITLYITGKYRVNLDYFKDRTRSQAYFLLGGVQGCIPLKVIIKEPTLTTENTAVLVQQAKYQTENFRLPQGIKLRRGLDIRR